MITAAPTIPVVEVPNEGLNAFLNKTITVWCLDFIRHGTLVGINDTFIKLNDASIVYETGDLTKNTFKDAQKTSGPIYVMKQAICHFEAGK